MFLSFSKKLEIEKVMLTKNSSISNIKGKYSQTDKMLKALVKY